MSDDFKKLLGIHELVRARPAIGGGFEFEADTPQELAQFLVDYQAKTTQPAPAHAPPPAQAPQATPEARKRPRAMDQDDHTAAPLLSSMFASMLAFKNLTDSSRKAYADRLRIFTETVGIGDRIATTYTRKDALAFQSMRRTQYNDKGLRLYSDASIDAACSALRAVFQFGKDRDLLPAEFANPFTGVKNLQSSKDKKANQYGFFDTAEVVKIFEQSRNDGENTRHWLAMLLCFVCGMRVGAACSMMPGDFGKDTKGRPFVRVRDDKTAAGARVVVLPQRLFDWLSPFIEEAQANGGPVLALQNGNARPGDAVSKYANRTIKAALGEEATARNLVLHSARKWCNSRAKAAGLPDSAILYFIGHEDGGVNMQVYTRYEPDDLHDIFGAFLASQLDALCKECPGTHAKPLQKRERRPDRLS